MCNYKVSLGVPFLLKGHIFISNLAIYNSDFLPILFCQFGSLHRSQTAVRSRTWQRFLGMTRPCCGTHSISSCLSCFKIDSYHHWSFTSQSKIEDKEKKIEKEELYCGQNHGSCIHTEETHYERELCFASQSKTWYVFWV